MDSLKTKFHNINFTKEEIGSEETSTQSATVFAVQVQDPDCIIKDALYGQFALTLVCEQIACSYPWNDWKIQTSNVKVRGDSITQMLTLRRIKGQFCVELKFMVYAKILIDDTKTTASVSQKEAKS